MTLATTTREADLGMGRPGFGSAVRWSYAMEGGRQVVSLATMLVLARLLGPAAFGVAALAMVYVLFIRMLLSQGLSAAIIQRKDLDPRHLDAAFWLVLAASAALTAASVGLAGWWASLNNSPELRGVVIALSLLIPVQALVIVQEAILRRNMDFRSLAVRTNVSTLAGGGVAIVAALAGAGVWALVLQQLVTEVLGLLLLWKLSAWRPRRRYSGSHARELLGFSTGSFLATIGVFVNNRADTLLVGLFFGPVVVGVYRLASRLAEVVVELTVRALQAAAFPMLSRLQDDLEELGRSTLRVVRVSALLAFPPLAILALSADSVTALLGPEWEAASVPLTVLCLAGGMRALSLFIGPVLQAVGRPHLFAGFTWVSAAASACTLVIAGAMTRSGKTADQLVAMASSRVVVHGFVTVVSVVLLRRLLRVSMPRLCRAVLPAVAGAVALLSVAGACRAFLRGTHELAAVSAVGLVGILVFAATVAALDRRARHAFRGCLAGIGSPSGPFFRSLNTGIANAAVPNGQRSTAKSPDPRPLASIARLEPLDGSTLGGDSRATRSIPLTDPAGSEGGDHVRSRNERIDASTPHSSCPAVTTDPN